MLAMNRATPVLAVGRERVPDQVPDPGHFDASSHSFVLDARKLTARFNALHDCTFRCSDDPRILSPVRRRHTFRCLSQWSLSFVAKLGAPTFKGHRSPEFLPG